MICPFNSASISPDAVGDPVSLAKRQISSTKIAILLHTVCSNCAAKFVKIGLNRLTYCLFIGAATSKDRPVSIMDTLNPAIENKYKISIILSFTKDKPPYTLKEYNGLICKDRSEERRVRERVE